MTITLRALLEMKQKYHEQWPGGRGTMPRGVLLAHKNLLREIKAAVKRNQPELPGMSSYPMRDSRYYYEGESMKTNTESETE